METSYLIQLLKEISDIMAENKDKLIAMDGIVGDGDLGLTMDLKLPMRRLQTAQPQMPADFYLRQERQWQTKFLLLWGL